MKAKESVYVANIVEQEGFDYAFQYYTEFEEVKDEGFHKLRKEYLEARKKLVDYVGLDDDYDHH